MRRPTALLMTLPAAVCLLAPLACKPRTRAPGWVQTAPADSLASLSGEAGWILSHKEIQSLVARDPMVERGLDLFLQKARINPRTETGRLTIHVVGEPPTGAGDIQKGLEHVLIQLNQFQNPAALVSALAESFPQEGSLRLQGRDWPLHVILDMEVKGVKAHLRAASDDKGQVWIGSLEALNRLAKGPTLDQRPDAALAAEWISARAPFQGYLQADALLGGLRKSLKEGPLQGSALPDLPTGVTALFWSVTPPPEKDQPIRFELALAGEPEGIAQVTPWIQRLIAAITAVPAGGAPAPELLQEKRRVGLRCSVTADQLKLLMEKLGQPGFVLPARLGAPKA